MLKRQTSKQKPETSSLENKSSDLCERTRCSRSFYAVPISFSTMLKIPGDNFQNYCRCLCYGHPTSIPFYDYSNYELTLGTRVVYMMYLYHNAVFFSRHFFGRLRLWKSEVPEPTPPPTTWVSCGSRLIKAAAAPKTKISHLSSPKVNY